MNIPSLSFKTRKAIVYGSFINLTVAFLILIVQTYTSISLFSTADVLVYGLIGSIFSAFNARDVYQGIRLATKPIFCPACQQKKRKQVMLPNSYVCLECGFKGTNSSR